MALSLMPVLRDGLRPVVRILRWLTVRVHGLYRALGLLLIIALALGLAGVWAFGELAENVLRGQTQRFDDAVLQWLHRHGSPGLDKWALQITAIGNGATVVVMTLILCAFLWVMRYRLGVLLLVMGAAGADLGHFVAKAAFGRPRPELFVIDTPHARPTSWSFPSGHATASMVLFALIAYLLIRLGARGWFRIISTGLAIALILAIGLSRMYLGVHYPSDVIAGYALGFAWITLCIFGVESVQLIRGRRQGQGAALKGPGPE